MDGRSLCDFLDGQQPADWRTYTYSELDFGNPISATAAQSALGLKAHEANLAVLRTCDHTLVQFASGPGPLLFAHSSGDPFKDVSKDPENAQILLELTGMMLRHRMQNPEGTFARTMVTSRGVQTG